MKVRLLLPRVRARTRRGDRGFTLIEVLIALVLSALIAGVVVAGLITALHIARSTTDQVGDSNDAGLISSFLVRDAQSAGGIDPTTALPDSTLGVSTNPLDGDATGCSPDPAVVKVRFSWIDRTSMLAQNKVVVTYSLVNEQLTRRICSTNNPSVDVMLGSKITSAVATCTPATSFCTGHPTSVSLALAGKGTGAPLNYTLTASLRSAASLMTILRPTELLAGGLLVPYASTVGSTIGASAQTTWTATGLPAGLSIDPLSGMVWGTPNPVGTFPVTATVTLKVTDTLYATVTTREYQIVIHAPPVAINDTYAPIEDTPFTPASGLLANDSHLEGSALTAILTSGVAHGTLVPNPNGSFTYTPEPNWNGADSFKYKANDGSLDSAVATVTLNVGPVNDPPVNQVPVTQETPRDTPEVFSNASNLISISDIDAGAGIVQVRLTATNGNVTLPNATGLASSTGSGTTTMTITGTIANINLSLVNATFTTTTNTTGTLTVVTSDLGNTGGAAATDTDAVTITVNSLGIFTARQNIGTVNLSHPDPTYSSPTYTVIGSGRDVWDNEDGFQFIYRPMTGDSSLTAQVVSETVTYSSGSQSPSCYKDASHQQPCPSVAKAGVMFRNDLTGVSAIHAMVGVTQGNGSEFVYRKNVGAGTGAASPGDSLDVPYWVRLTRKGTEITAEISPNGTTWTQRGVTQTIAFGTTIYVGLAVSAVNQLDGDAPTLKLNTATFDNVSISTPPKGLNDTYSVVQYTTLTVPAVAGVLANDSDPESNSLTAKLGSGPAHGTLSLNGDGSFVYTPTPSYNGPDSFTYSANDGVFDSTPATVTITVKPGPPPNTAPSFLKGANQSIRASLGAQTVPAWATTITPNVAAGEASQLVDFVVTNDNPALFSVQPAVSANGTLIYAPAAAVGGLAAIGTATVSVIIHDNGGTTNGGIDASAPPQTFTIIIVAPPVLTTSSTTLAYTENAPPTVIDPAILITDADSNNLTSATVTLAIGYVNGQDVLAFTNQNGITGAWNPATGVLTLTGTASVANYQSALRSVTYSNSSDNPSTTRRTVTFMGSDGLVNSNTVNRTITLTAVNDGPVNIVPGVQKTTTDFAKVFSSGNGNVISITDPDAGASSLQVQLISTNGKAALSGIGGLAFTVGDGSASADMTFTGTLSSINSALAGLSFVPNAGFVGTANLEIKTSDQYVGLGGAAIDADIVAITVASSACPGTINGWRGQYFGNATLSGNAMLCTDDANINFDWGANAPDAALPSDNFSVRWTKTQTFAAGYYTFTVGADDGSRLFIDGVKVPELDKWTPKAYSTFTKSVFLSNGSHTIVMEYFDQSGGAAVVLTWVATTPPSCSVAASGWLGQYFGNMSLTGTPAECRDDANVNFNWGGGAPITGMLPDGFSVRWTKTQTFDGGTYNFALTSDDGSRLYIDDNTTPVVNNWGDHGSTQVNVSKTLPAGPHKLVVEFYENGGGALATLVITNPPTAPSLAFSAFNNTYWSAAGSPVYYRSAASAGSFTTTASSTDSTSGIASYTFPALGANWTSSPGALGVNTYSWTGSPAAPGAPSVTAINGAGLNSAGSPLTLIVDNTAPTGDSVSYSTATTSATSVSVSVNTGADAGSGIGTRLLQRQSATLTGVAGGTCGTYGPFATVANGTNPASLVTDPVSRGNCYVYRYVVTDNVGNQDIVGGTSVVKVRQTYLATINGDPGLLSYWRLGESSGAPLADSKGTNTGTYFNVPTFGVAGAIAGDTNTAVTFNGSNEYGQVARAISGDFSIEFWFQSTQGRGTTTPWSVAAGLVDANATSTTANDFGVALRSDGVVIAGVKNVSILSAAGYDDGGWHHVVFTRTSSSGALKLYVDGNLSASGTGVSNTSLSASANISFGRIQTAGTTYFLGSLDEIAVYTTVLDQATVTAHHDAG